jgi:hypothetical protein
MKKLTLDLQNCYGIKSLKHKFDFEEQNVYAIYAGNGLMKTSFAQIFKDYATGKESKDRIFPNRPYIRTIIEETGAQLPPENILVISPYDEAFGHNEKTSTLLVNATLRKEYEDLQKGIEDASEILVKSLKQQSNSKKDLEKEISATFTSTDEEFHIALSRIKSEIDLQKDAPFSSVQYDVIFDDKVLAVLDKKDFKIAIHDYIRRYGELLDKSTYFKKGVFEYYNASTIAKTLADQGFFDALHTVNLNATEKKEIKTKKDLEDIISAEKETITNDDILRKKFEDLEKLLNANVNTREFKSYIIANQHLLPHLSNIKKFKEDVWKSFLKESQGLYNDVVEKYISAEKRKQEIEKLAANQRTDWETAIDLFNERFFVPFKLFANNRTSVILGDEPMLSLGFEFTDGGETAKLDKNVLLQVLSQGEKKALYILNIIFEIEVRRKSGVETIFVVDDIADSFDYKNKYAIIQYLKDIADNPNFREIILTHNFDFFRIINSRFVSYSHCLMAVRSSTGITLDKAQGIKNIFVNDWKKNFFTDNRKKIASIPFLRNIVEYTKGEEHEDFKKLTSLLHWKEDTDKISVKDLDEMFGRYFNETVINNIENKLAVDLIKTEADKCEASPNNGINFEHKIILSIAIRLVAEEYMINKIAEPNFIKSIMSNQTQELVKKFLKKFSEDANNIKVLQNVALMTPENIHLNSFMYEPILDMSDEHLRKLYKEAKRLS